MSREVSCDLAQEEEASTSSNSKVMNTLMTKYSCFRRPQPSATVTGRRRYLTSLWVFGDREADEPESPLPTSFSRLMAENMIDHQMVKEKIKAALAGLYFREPRVLIQFWSPVAVGKRCLLTTLDQPFGLGIVDEGLYFYRLESEHHMFVVDGEYEENELGPPGRVYRQKWPEWSLDAHRLSTKQYVQEDRAVRHDIRGYLDLPVFDPSSGCCVGVLELVMSSDYLDYAYEVQEISRALKEADLKSLNVFDDPSFFVQVGEEKKQLELDEIFTALKMVCDLFKLPLAQTWALSGYSSFVANAGNLEKSCSSFNKSCIGKACMSTAALPFYIRDLGMWYFREACTERHLEKSQGVVGRSLSSHGSCFCEDVKELGEDEYPLVHIARMNGVTGCLAIYMESVEGNGEYVIELFLPAHITNETHIQDLVKTVKQQIQNSSVIRLENILSTEVIGGESFTWSFESPVLPKSSLAGGREVPVASENLQFMSENQQDDVDRNYIDKRNDNSIITCSENMEEEEEEEEEEDDVENDQFSSATAGKSYSAIPYNENKSEDVANPQRIRENVITYQEKQSAIPKKQSRKRKRTDKSMSIGLEEIKQHFGKTMEEAAVNLHVSRSTLKRICRSLGIIRWPYSKSQKESDPLLKSKQTDEAFHASRVALASASVPLNEPSGAADRTCVPPTLALFGKPSLTFSVEQEQANLPAASSVPDSLVSAKPDSTTEREHIEYTANTIEKIDLSLAGRGNFTRIREMGARIVTIKATYENDTVKFPFLLSQGLVKLEELVAARFQLKVGSFSVKYWDEDGDLILIACDNDLWGLTSALRQSDGNTVIKLSIQPVTN